MKNLKSSKNITLKKFIKDFDISSPDWSNVPKGFPDCDLDRLANTEIGKWNAILTMWQLSRPETPKQRSRTWQDPKGYQYLGVWQNAALLRIFIRKFTLTLPLKESRLKAQMDDAARSVKRNIEEGWKRSTTSEYLQFLSYSQGSLEEVKGDIRDCKDDGFLPSKPLTTLKNTLNIDLNVLKGVGKGKVKGEPTEKDHPYSQPLKTLDPKSLTYEMFIELVNKTDFLLRRLVESLERKLDSDRKGYKIEQEKIKDKFRNK